MIDYDKELFVKDHIRTFSGQYFNAFEPDPNKIYLIDIAHALSQQPRYGGHLPVFYSVAQHSMYVAWLLPKRLKLAGLLHDASEAYLCDIPSPFKSRMPEYKEVEKKLQDLILQTYGVTLSDEDNAMIKQADTIALKHEWNNLMMKRDLYYPCMGAVGIPQHYVKAQFMSAIDRYLRT